MGDTNNDDPYLLSDKTIQPPPKSLLSALAQIGPGIVLAGSIIGSGELLLTTGLGAQYGFVFLWLILFSCVIKVFVQIELGRYTISSGLPTLSALDQLPGWRLGAHWLVWWWFVMLLGSVFQLGGMVGGVGQALNLAFPAVVPWLADFVAGASPTLADLLRRHPEHPWAVLTAVTAVLLLLSGGYKRIEWITTILIVGVTFVTVACVAMLPGTGFPVRLTDLREGFSLAVLTLPAAALAAAFSTFGITGVGASELYSYPYWCLEKGYARFTGPRSPDPAWAERARGWLRVMYLDAWVSMVVFTVATVAFYVMGATVLHRQGLNPEKSKMIATLSEMYVPAFGKWTEVFFLIGVWAVLFKTLYVASAGHSRLMTDFLGLTRVVKFTDAKQRPRWIRRFCVFFPSLALMLYLFVRDPKIMVIIGGFFQAATLPIISGAALYLRYFRTDSRLTPSRLSDGLLWFAFLTITAFSLYAIPQWAMNDLWPLLKKLTVGGP
ncbi:MAG: Nramp family divalent metal transporter [Pirellulaceae bacterium]